MNVFTEFAVLPVQGISGNAESDGMLFQTGVYDWGEGDALNFSCLRQFTFDDADGEYDHLEQLEALLLYPPDDELRALPVDEIWSFGLTLDDYVRKVEATEAFSVITGVSREPIGLSVRLEEV